MTQIVHSETAYGGYAKVIVLTLSDRPGDEYQREVVSFGSSACVLPYDPERKVALIIRLPRAPLLLAGIETRLVEAPAGMIEAGESPEVTIRREAIEEAGVALGELEPVAACWSSPGVVAERSHLFLAPYATADRRGAGGGLAEEHEGIVAEEVPLADLWRWQEQGELHDMKTLTLVMALRLRHSRLF
jgi:nudix-type nucleoside diphosphatase (YffH/AdpP family)